MAKPRQRTVKGDIVRQYIAKHPDMPHVTLARMIYADHPKLFSSASAVRLSVQYYTGRRKNGSGKKVADPVISIAENNRTRFQYRAPDTHADGLEDIVIHGAQRILRLADIHYPFHDPRALEAAVEYGMRHDPTILLLDGDIMDCHDVSDHDKMPTDRYTEIELRMVADELRQFRMAFPKARIVWKEGNHEARLQRYLARRAPDLWGLPFMDIPGLVTMVGGADAMTGVEWVSDKRAIYAGKLALLHGHEFAGGGGGVNPARWLFLRTGQSAVCGHFHRTSEHSEPRLSGEQIGTWSTGCLCDMRPKYMPHNKWNHGFAYVEVEEGGDFRVKNIRVIGGKII